MNDIVNPDHKGLSEKPKVLNWKHLQDELLYSDNDYAVEKLRTGLKLETNEFTTTEPAEKINYHCYWYGDIGHKQVFSIKSFLCTQDTRKCKLTLWLDAYNGFENYVDNTCLQEVLGFIEVKAYHPLKEVKNTPWEYYFNVPHDNYNLARRSDAFRFIILHNYGGLYFDLDVMFLKDLGILLNSEFCYAWEKQNYANSALLNLKKKSYISNYILEKSVNNNTVFPWDIFDYSDPLLRGLLVLPSAFFDPIWQGLKAEEYPFVEFQKFFSPFDHTFTNKFNILTYKDFYTGCFAYHWHNQWNVTEYENSFFGIFDKEFSKILRVINK